MAVVREGKRPGGTRSSISELRALHHCTCPAPWGQETTPLCLHPFLLSLPTLTAAFQPQALVPSFSRPQA